MSTSHAQLVRFFARSAPAEPPEVSLERARVKDFVARAVDSGVMTPSCDSWMSGVDPAFSRLVGERGWIGMTWPKRYGGHDTTRQLRYAVIEELLAAGAPVAAHWFADRQVGPSLLTNGTEEQRQFFLPRIARGELFFCIGMSEPESGSDLGSVGTRGVPADDGLIITGSKIWTSHAADAHYMLALVRTGARDEHVSRSLTQVIVDLSSPGVTVRPILMMDGRSDFCEVFLDEVAVPTHRIVGEVGRGWSQVLSELSYERSGPERFLSTMPLVDSFLDDIDLAADDRDLLAEAGRMLARFMTMRAMAARVNDGMLGSDIGPVAAALVKDIGTRFELETISTIADLPSMTARRLSATTRDRMLDSRTHSPGFTLRGGTNEVLRGIVARALMPG